MPAMPIRIFLVLFIFVLIYPSALPAATEQRIALVIGNSAYSSGPLKNPVNDATDMAAALQRLGFKVNLKKNANLETMEGAIEDFGNHLKRGGVGLFYYAGHGVQVNGVNYLIPIGAKVNKESDVRYRAVDAGRILDEMANANNGLNIVILDACRDNPFGKSFRSASRGLAIVSNSPSGTFISYSTSPGHVANDGKGKNSPYTEALLENISKPGLTINSVFMKVRGKVKKETGQIPWELSSLEGDFFFVPGSTKIVIDESETKEVMEKQTKKEDVEKQAVQISTLEPSSFADLKKKMEEKREKESQLVKDFEDAKKMETDSSDINEKIQVWRQFIATLPDERTAKGDEIWKYASNRAEMLERWRVSGKTPPKEIKGDGRFIAYDDGTVLDAKTNLMWASRDNGIKQPKSAFQVMMSSDDETSKKYHSNAKSFCENYRGGGYTDWRMPTRNELQWLYDRNKSNHVATDLINISSIWIWASETKDAKCYGAFFNMKYGSASSFCPGDMIIPAALPVRSIK